MDKKEVGNALDPSHGLGGVGVLPFLEGDHCTSGLRRSWQCHRSFTLSVQSMGLRLVSRGTLMDIEETDNAADNSHGLGKVWVWTCLR